MKIKMQEANLRLAPQNSSLNPRERTGICKAMTDRKPQKCNDTAPSLAVNHQIRPLIAHMFNQKQHLPS